jgi:hypothetical protein
MSLIRIGFGKILKLNDNLAEVFIDEGVELTKEQINSYYDTIQQHLIPPYCVLLNQINSYTYSFEAQQELGKYEGLNAKAILSYTESSKKTMQLLKETQTNLAKLNMEIFSERSEALNWLKQNNCSNCDSIL